MYQVWQQKGAMSARELGRPHTALSRRASPVVRDDDHRKGHGDDAQAGEQRDEARLHSRCVWARFVLRVARGQGRSFLRRRLYTRYCPGRNRSRRLLP